MEELLSLSLYRTIGHHLLLLLFGLSCLTGSLGVANLLRSGPLWPRCGAVLFGAVSCLFVAGFVWICWFHYQIFHALALELPPAVANMLNQHLADLNQGAAYGLPLYSETAPPRYLLPPWLENEKYYFWFMCFALLALVFHRRSTQHRLRGALALALALQVAILFFWADPFVTPLPKFFGEIAPWIAVSASVGEKLGLFMQLYPKMVFYYNAHYMWFHPPLLFLSYACITITFVASLFMLAGREPAVEKVGYDSAILGFFLLTLGMLLGYPWALKAWGPNWWWDPKICSSIMMWAIYSTYLHTRLFINRPSMWYFSAILGILCFLAMLFTFVSSFFFPGEHSFVS
ncbi:MAG: cytochrome c biogenesis protein CcsA [Thermodesulfobacteriota bacterium]